MRPVVLQLISEQYPAVAANLLNPLLELLHVSKRTCGGDIDKFLILLVVAARVAEHPTFGELTPDQLAGGRVSVLPSLGTNVRSVSDSIDIPKETVRRKVAELIDAGWLFRRGRELSLTASAYQVLAPVREQIESLAARNWETVSSLLAKGPGLR